MWQGCSYGCMALAAGGGAAGWALLLASKLALGFALKRIANLYVRHYDERHTKARCGLAMAPLAVPLAQFGLCTHPSGAVCERADQGLAVWSR